MNFQSLKKLLIILGWLTIQTAVVGHEFSEEHWFSSTNHICLTQAVQFEDLLPSTNAELSPLSEQVFLLTERNNQIAVFKWDYSVHHSRAPPL